MIKKLPAGQTTKTKILPHSTPKHFLTALVMKVSPSTRAHCEANVSKTELILVTQIPWSSSGHLAQYRELYHTRAVIRVSKSEH